MSRRRKNGRNVHIYLKDELFDTISDTATRTGKTFTATLENMLEGYLNIYNSERSKDFNNPISHI